MPNSKIETIVRNVAENVAMYATLASRADTYRRLVSALLGVAAAITQIDPNNASVTFGEGSDEMTLSAKVFQESADALKVDNTDLLSLSVEVNKGITKVKSYIEDELVEGDLLDVAQQTVTLWEQVRGSRKTPATSSRAQGERLSQADFNFAIFSTCELCGEVVVKGGERTGRLDWNSLRHYSQKHAIDRHGSHGFTQLVSDAWAQAREEFRSGEVTEVHVSGDSDMPGFTLVRQ